MSWTSNVFQFGNWNTKRIARDVWRHPEKALEGRGDFLGSEIWNLVTGKHDQPYDDVGLHHLFHSSDDPKYAEYERETGNSAEQIRRARDKIGAAFAIYYAGYGANAYMGGNTGFLSNLKMGGRLNNLYGLASGVGSNPGGTGPSTGGQPAIPTSATTTSQDPWQGSGDPWQGTSDPWTRTSSNIGSATANPTAKKVALGASPSTTTGPHGTGPVKVSGTAGAVTADGSAIPTGTGGNMSFLGNLLHSVPNPLMGGGGGGGNPLQSLMGGAGPGGLPGSPFGGTGFGNLVSGGAATDAERAAAMNDPFGAQRYQYQQQMNYLMANPSSVQSQPGYKAEQELALESTQRQLAASGQTNSTLAFDTMAQVGPRLQQQYYDRQFGKLAMLSGAQLSPQDPGGTYLRGRQPVQQAQSSFLGTAAGFLGNKFMNLFGMSGGTDPGTGGTNLFEGGNVPGNYYSGMDWSGGGGAALPIGETGFEAAY